MHRIRALIAFVVSIVVWSQAPSSVYADFGVYLGAGSNNTTILWNDSKNTSGTTNEIYVSNSTQGAVTFKSVDVTTNLPGSSELAMNSGDTTKITVSNKGSNSTTVTFAFSANGFTSPTAPPSPALQLLADLSGTLSSGTINGGSVEAFVYTTSDGSTTYFSKSAASSHGNVITDTTGSFGSLSGNALSFGLNLAGSPFQLNKTYGITWIVTLDLAANTTISFSGGDADVVALPAPSGLVLSMVAFPFLGLCLLTRRRYYLRRLLK